MRCANTFTRGYGSPHLRRGCWLLFFALMTVVLIGFASVAAKLVVTDSSDGQPGIPGIPAEGPTDFFVPAEPPISTPRRSDPAIVRSRPVRIVRESLARPERLVGKEFIVELFEDTVVSLSIDRLRRRSLQAYTLTGRVTGADWGFFTLVADEDVVVASIRMPGRHSYQLRYLGQGVHEVLEIDDSLDEPYEDAVTPPRTRLSGDTTTPESLQSLADDGSELDVLVVYTPAAKAAAGGAAAINAIIELGISEANFALDNSAVSMRFRLVHKEEIDYQESGDTGVDLGRLRRGGNTLDRAHVLRDSYCADVVSLIVDDSPSRTYMMGRNSLPPFDFAPYAVSVIQFSSFVGGLYFAHMVGHNLGSEEDRENATDLPAFDRSYGYRIPDRWRSVMAQSAGCSSCPRMPFFSNPDLTFEGIPTGVQGGDPNGADNALTFELTKEIAANWRVSCVSHDPIIPVQPGDILVSCVGSDELLSVDPSNGDRAEISSDEAGSGPLLRGPYGLEMAWGGQILVASVDNNALLRVDPQNGDRTLFSGCANLDCSSVVGTGPDFRNIFMLALESSGDVVVTDRSGPMLFRVARDSGDRAILSGCVDAECSSLIGTGPVFLRPNGIAVESSGSILVGDYDLGSIFRVDPITGDRTVISGCVDEFCSSSVGSGVAFESLAGIALEVDGSILAAELNAYLGSSFRAVFRVDPVTGNRTIASGCAQFECTSWVGAGAMFDVPVDIALDENGYILLSDFELHSIFRVDPGSGDRVLLSGCADAACLSVLGGGPWFAGPVGIAVVPEPARWPMLVAGTAFLGLLYRRRARRLRIG
jgi:hypothetical protein